MSFRSERGHDSKSKLLKADITGRVAVNHAWDMEEPRLLIVEAKLVPGTERSDIRHQLNSSAGLMNSKQDLSVIKTATSIVVSLFVLEDQGVIVHDSTQILVNVCNIKFCSGSKGLCKGAELFLYSMIFFELETINKLNLVL